MNERIPGSWLRGSSTSNSPIERFWGELMSKCLENIKLLFVDMENRYFELEVHNPVHMTALHYVFLPIMNMIVSRFVASKNHQPHRSHPRSMSPYQYYIRESLRYNTQHRIRDDVTHLSSYDNWEPKIDNIPGLQLSGEEFDALLQMLNQQLPQTELVANIDDEERCRLLFRRAVQVVTDFMSNR